MSVNVPRLVFGSNLAYRKIAADGEVTTTGTGTYTVSHNLGYVPGFAVWCESFSGQLWPAIDGGASNPYDPDGSFATVTVEATSTQLIFTYIGAASRKIVWRVYYDD